jgi:hypothetical protein
VDAFIRETENYKVVYIDTPDLVECEVCSRLTRIEWQSKVTNECVHACDVHTDQMIFGAIDKQRVREMFRKAAKDQAAALSVRSGLVTIPSDTKVAPVTSRQIDSRAEDGFVIAVGLERPVCEHEKAYPVSLNVQVNNHCYVSYSDTDIQTDYFHGYSMDSLASMIRFLSSDKPTHPIALHFVNGMSDWTLEKMDKVTARFKAAGIPVEPEVI